MQLKLHMVTIEDLVPEGHFLRRLEQALDLSFVYEEISYMLGFSFIIMCLFKGTDMDGRRFVASAKFVA